VLSFGEGVRGIRKTNHGGHVGGHLYASEQMERTPFVTLLVRPAAPYRSRHACAAGADLGSCTCLATRPAVVLVATRIAAAASAAAGPDCAYVATRPTVARVGAGVDTTASAAAGPDGAAARWVARTHHTTRARRHAGAAVALLGRGACGTTRPAVVGVAPGIDTTASAAGGPDGTATRWIAGTYHTATRARRHAGATVALLGRGACVATHPAVVDVAPAIDTAASAAGGPDGTAARWIARTRRRAARGRRHAGCRGGRATRAS